MLRKGLQVGIVLRVVIVFRKGLRVGIVFRKGLRVGICSVQKEVTGNYSVQEGVVGWYSVQEGVTGRYSIQEGITGRYSVQKEAKHFRLILLKLAERGECEYWLKFILFIQQFFKSKCQNVKSRLYFLLLN